MKKTYFVHCTFTVSNVSKFGWFFDTFDVESTNVPHMILQKLSKQLSVPVNDITCLDVQTFNPI